MPVAPSHFLMCSTLVYCNLNLERRVSRYIAIEHGLPAAEGGNAKSKAMSPRKGAGVLVGVSFVDLQVEEGGRVALGGLMNVGS